MCGGSAVSMPPDGFCTAPCTAPCLHLTITTCGLQTACSFSQMPPAQIKHPGTLLASGAPCYSSLPLPGWPALRPNARRRRCSFSARELGERKGFIRSSFWLSVAGQTPSRGHGNYRTDAACLVTKYPEPHGMHQLGLSLAHIYAATPANLRISIMSGLHTMNRQSNFSPWKWIDFENQLKITSFCFRLGPEMRRYLCEI